MVRKRKFVIMNLPKRRIYYGRYPIQAANKAFTYLSRQVDLKNSDENNFMVFTMMEEGSNEKFTFVGTRVQLASPEIRNINGKTISFKYKNVISRYSPEKFPQL